MWAECKQTRSFTFIDDCVEGVFLLMFSDCEVPTINLFGRSTEMVDLIEFAQIALGYEDKDHNSNKVLIMQPLKFKLLLPMVCAKPIDFWIKVQAKIEAAR
jgi:nucleoside-diphosphate-sugar epimerase